MVDVRILVEDCWWAVDLHPSSGGFCCLYRDYGRSGRDRELSPKYPISYADMIDERLQQERVISQCCWSFECCKWRRGWIGKREARYHGRSCCERRPLVFLVL